MSEVHPTQIGLWLRHAREAALGAAPGRHPAMKHIILQTGALLAPAGPGPALWECEATDLESCLMARWRSLLDWAAERGITGVLCWGLREGYDYSWAVDWTQTEFPEAAIASPEQVAETLRMANAILEYAAYRGVRVYLHNFHLTMPAALAEKYPEVGGCPDKDPRWYAYVCWQSPLVREFTEAAIRGTLEALPHLTGRCDPYGEWSDCLKHPEHAGMDKSESAAAFAHMYLEVHRQLGRSPLMRAWWLRSFARNVHSDIRWLMPQGMPYVMKLSITDAVTTEPDQELLDWQEAGHEIIAMLGDENTQGLRWADPHFYHDCLASVRRYGLSGVLVPQALGDPAKAGFHYVNLDAVVDYASGHLPLGTFDPEPWSRYLGALVETDEGKKLLESQSLTAGALRSLSRVVGEWREGISLYLPIYFLPPKRWLSTLGFDNADPPDEWSREVFPLLDLLGAIETTGYIEGMDRDIAASAGRLSPLEYLEQRRAEAEQGLALLRDIQARREELFADMQHSGRLAVEFIAYWRALLEARLLWEAALNSRGERRAHWTAAFTAVFDVALHHLRVLSELEPAHFGEAELPLRVNERREALQALAEFEQILHLPPGCVLKAPQRSPVRRVTPPAQLRAQGAGITWAGSGEVIYATLAAAPLPLTDGVVYARWLDAEGRYLARGIVERRPQAVSVVCEEAGPRVLLLTSHRSPTAVPPVTLRVGPGPFCFIASESYPLYLCRTAARLYFYVPCEVTDFSATLFCPFGDEAARLRIFTPEGILAGEVVAYGTGARGVSEHHEEAHLPPAGPMDFTVHVTVPRTAAGAIWSLAIGPPQEPCEGRVFRNARLYLSPELPPLLAHTPEELFVTEE